MRKLNRRSAAHGYLQLTTDWSPAPPGSDKKQEETYQTWPENPEPSSEARKSW